MRINGDYAVFSTGKRVYANNGIIGLSINDEDEFSVTEGYDGGFFEFDDYEVTLTKEEQLELADYMISLWTDFKARSERGRRA